MSEELAFVAPLYIDDAPKRKGRVASVNDLDAGTKGLELLIIGEGTAAKEAMGLLRSITLSGSRAGFGDFAGMNRWSYAALEGRCGW